MFILVYTAICMSICHFKKHFYTFLITNIIRIDTKWLNDSYLPQIATSWTMSHDKYWPWSLMIQVNPSRFDPYDLENGHFIRKNGNLITKMIFMKIKFIYRLCKKKMPNCFIFSIWRVSFGSIELPKIRRRRPSMQDIIIFFSKLYLVYYLMWFQWKDIQLLCSLYVQNSKYIRFL